VVDVAPACVFKVTASIETPSMIFIETPTVRSASASAATNRPQRWFFHLYFAICSKVVFRLHLAGCSTDCLRNPMREGTAEGSAGIQDWKREAVSHDWKAGSHKVVLN